MDEFHGNRAERLRRVYAPHGREFEQGRTPGRIRQGDRQVFAGGEFELHVEHVVDRILLEIAHGQDPAGKRDTEHG